MIPKHKILYVRDYCDYIVDPPRSVFVESLPAFMSITTAVDLFNNGLSYKRLIDLFNELFLSHFNTCLESGHDEPIYLPEEEKLPARVCFRADYASSALHEVAHWCIAGEKRRKKIDYGYWYEPDGRSNDQQQQFEKVEVKPQALEWIFSVAAGIRFRISVDNLEGDSKGSAEFAEAVVMQAQEYLQAGLPERAQLYYLALLAEGQGKEAETTDFSIAKLS